MDRQLKVVAIRLVEEQPLLSESKIQKPEDAVLVMGNYLSDFDREVLCVINLKADGTPVNCNFVSIGAANESLAHPREIFKSAILANATSMILIHNHPSGNVCPSKEDTSITDRMLKVGDILGIPLVDHVIVGKRNQPYFSFREHKLMDFNHVALETDYMQLQFSTTLVAEEKMEPVQESENEKVAEEAITEEQEPVRRRRGR